MPPLRRARATYAASSSEIARRLRSWVSESVAASARTRWSWPWASDRPIWLARPYRRRSWWPSGTSRRRPQHRAARRPSRPSRKIGHERHRAHPVRDAERGRDRRSGVDLVRHRFAGREPARERLDGSHRPLDGVAVQAAPLRRVPAHEQEVAVRVAQRERPDAPADGLVEPPVEQLERLGLLLLLRERRREIEQGPQVAPAAIGDERRAGHEPAREGDDADRARDRPRRHRISRTTGGSRAGRRRPRCSRRSPRCPAPHPRDDRRLERQQRVEEVRHPLLLGGERGARQVDRGDVRDEEQDGLAGGSSSSGSPSRSVSRWAIAAPSTIATAAATSSGRRQVRSRRPGPG